MKNLSFAFTLIIFLLSCNSSNDINSLSPAFEEKHLFKEESIPPRTVEAPSSTYNWGNQNMEKSTIIKKGDVEIEVIDIMKAKKKIDSLVLISKGYFENEVFNNSTYNQYYELKIRVPAEKFDALIESLNFKDGSMQSKSISADDVTEEFIDLGIRLESNMAYLNRYTQMLKSAKTIKEMIAIQEKIRNIEKLIDTNKGRLNYLQSRVSLSTLNIMLRQSPEDILAETEPTFLDDLSDAFDNGVSGILMVLIVMVNLWPAIILAILIVFYIRYKTLNRIHLDKQVN